MKTGIFVFDFYNCEKRDKGQSPIKVQKNSDKNIEAAIEDYF